MVKCFDDYVFQFIAQILFDGAFVRFRNLGVIGQDSYGAKILSAAPFICGEQLLHRIRGIGTIIQDLRKRRMPRAYFREGIAQRFGAFLALVAFAP